MNKTELGNWGEFVAANFLRNSGYDIVARNYRTRLGEIDIIAHNAEVTAFVEVKLRKDDRFAKALESVTRSKQAKIIAAAKAWLTENEDTPQPRFDVIEVYAPQGDKTEFLKINHIKNAFET